MIVCPVGELFLHGPAWNQCSVFTIQLTTIQLCLCNQETTDDWRPVRYETLFLVLMKDLCLYLSIIDTPDTPNNFSVF